MKRLMKLMVIAAVVAMVKKEIPGAKRYINMKKM